MTTEELILDYVKQGAVFCIPDIGSLVVAVGLPAFPNEGCVHWAEPFFFEQQHIHTFAYDSVSITPENSDETSDVIFVRNGKTITVLTFVHSDHVPAYRYKQLWPLLHNWHGELEHPGKRAEAQADFKDSIPTTTDLETH